MIAIRDFVRLLLYLVAIIYATTYINQTHFGYDFWTSVKKTL